MVSVYQERVKKGIDLASSTSNGAIHDDQRGALSSSAIQCFSARSCNAFPLSHAMLFPSVMQCSNPPRGFDMSGEVEL